jgi:hypothetical protein
MSISEIDLFKTVHPTASPPPQKAIFLYCDTVFGEREVVTFLPLQGGGRRGMKL